MKFNRDAHRSVLLAVVLASAGVRPEPASAWPAAEPAEEEVAAAAEPETPLADPAAADAGEAPGSGATGEAADGDGVEIWFLGAAREISHSTSASRDTPAPTMTIAPRPILTGGADFSVFCLRWGGMTWRLGFLGMLELESETEIGGFNGSPVGDIHFWRGVYGYGLAFSPDRLAERWLGPGSALEITLSGRHESEHYTGSNAGGDGIDYGDRPHIGNFVMPDLAMRWRVGPVDMILRLQHKFFLPGGSAYTHGPGGDLIVRWRLWEYIHPFLSVFGEYLLGTDVEPYGRFPDAYLVRGLLGIIVPSGYGDLYVYLSGDVGHRKGLAVFTEEATLGFGIRAAFF
jgi:hypothetical protein